MRRIFTILLLIVPCQLRSMERPPRALPPRPFHAPPSPPVKRTYAQALMEQGASKKTLVSPLARSSGSTEELPEDIVIVRHKFDDELMIEELFLPFDCKYRGTDSCDMQFTDQEADLYWQHIVRVHGIISARYLENNLPINLVDPGNK